MENNIIVFTVALPLTLNLLAIAVSFVVLVNSASVVVSKIVDRWDIAQHAMDTIARGTREKRKEKQEADKQVSNSKMNVQQETKQEPKIGRAHV